MHGLVIPVLNSLLLYPGLLFVYEIYPSSVFIVLFENVEKKCVRKKLGVNFSSLIRKKIGTFE